MRDIENRNKEDKMVEGISKRMKELNQKREKRQNEQWNEGKTERI